MINLMSARRSLKSLVIAGLLLLHATSFAQASVETDTICNDPFGAFEVASKFAKDGNVPRGVFLMHCQRIAMTEFRIDPDHPHLMAADQHIYGIFKVTHGNTTKYALAKIR